MIRRCKHFWDESTRVYTPSFVEHMATLGMARFKTGDFLDQGSKDRAMYGFTTIELVCVHCGDVKASYLLGNVPAPAGGWRDPGKTGS